MYRLFWRRIFHELFPYLTYVSILWNVGLFIPRPFVILLAASDFSQGNYTAYLPLLTFSTVVNIEIELIGILLEELCVENYRCGCSWVDKQFLIIYGMHNKMKSRIRNGNIILCRNFHRIEYEKYLRVLYWIYYIYRI